MIERLMAWALRNRPAVVFLVALTIVAVALGVGAANDPTSGGPLAAFSPSIAAAVSTGATLNCGGTS